MKPSDIIKEKYFRRLVLSQSFNHDYFSAAAECYLAAFSHLAEAPILTEFLISDITREPWNEHERVTLTGYVTHRHGPPEPAAFFDFTDGRSLSYIRLLKWLTDHCALRRFENGDPACFDGLAFRTGFNAVNEHTARLCYLLDLDYNPDRLQKLLSASFNDPGLDPPAAVNPWLISYRNGVYDHQHPGKLYPHSPFLNVITYRDYDFNPDSRQCLEDLERLEHRSPIQRLLDALRT